MLEIIKNLLPTAQKLVEESDHPKLVKTIAAMYAVGSAGFNIALAIEKNGFQVKDLAAAFSIETLGALAFIGFLIYSNKKRKSKK